MLREKFVGRAVCQEIKQEWSYAYQIKRQLNFAKNTVMSFGH